MTGSKSNLEVISQIGQKLEMIKIYGAPIISIFIITLYVIVINLNMKI